MTRDYDIDFVIPWVDGSDPAWLTEKANYSGSDMGIEDSIARYRDWGLLRYWFRGVEQFAPWVRKIHFVTWGHYPEWLNLDHPKLHLVKHEDYIPEEYLPTFSANTIELNFHRIEGLADRFVYFNDDMFLIRPTKAEDFFEKGLPKIPAIGTPLKVGYGDWFFMSIVDNAVINQHFDFHGVVKRHPLKWINPKYGLNVLRTLTVLPYPYFCGIMEFHLANPLTKKAYLEVWEKEEALLDSTCRNRVRSTFDVNQYLVKNWQLAKGEFMPGNPALGKAFQFRDTPMITLKDMATYIESGHGRMVCINDSAVIEKADQVIVGCQRIMKKLLPNKSAFEL
ncbi:Capsular polysaccharide phosphotransferase SacB [Slackia heliotrinireducens]|nr:Capsular polysaccharide phosphotransferase SacB [Slackia heliotrinireducens]